MRLKSVFISEYKNLKNFSLDFENESFLDIFVGKNGSGKSNFFEALIELFRHLDSFDPTDLSLGFEYKIVYEIDNQTTEIEWRDEVLLISGKPRKSLGKTPFPDNILIYYSGHNKTIGELVQRYETAFSSRVRRAGPGETRRFIGIGPDYKELLLAVMLLQPDDCKARQYICEKLKIDASGSKFTLNLARPEFASRLDVDPGVEETFLWGADGIVRGFLDRLLKCIKGGYSTASLFDSDGDQFVIPIDRELYLKEFEDYSSSDLFRSFDNLKSVGMLGAISNPITMVSGNDANISFFSDGQFQSVYIYSITELFNDRNCITLLDEPDSFLHPEWQFGFLQQVAEISEDAANTNHILLCSHSASTITRSESNQIRLFDFDGEKVTVRNKNKTDIIKSLSAGLITLTEREASLGIENILENTQGAVLFTEGATDKIILECAKQKLYNGDDLGFEIQGAFDRIFLRNMFSREELKKNYRGRKMFALFDFDEAYNDWCGLKLGKMETTDPFLGLTKQLKYKNHYAMLLPVPDNEKIRNQTLDGENVPWGGSGCKLSIELLFYDSDNSNVDFISKPTPGGGEIVEFGGDKMKFAQEVVSTYPSDRFEIFRPMFEFISSKLDNSS